MSVSNPERVVTKQDLKDFYDEIRPYLGGSGGASIATLSDVELTSLSNSQILKYDSSSQKWVNAAESGGSPWTEVTGTLTAGQTSITLSDAAITSSSTIDVYTDGDVDYNSVTPGTGSVTITFDVQPSNLGVKVRVS